MSAVPEIKSSIWTILGLGLDVIGFLLLGIDLIRLQVREAQRNDVAQALLSEIRKKEDELGELVAAEILNAQQLEEQLEQIDKMDIGPRTVPLLFSGIELSLMKHNGLAEEMDIKLKAMAEVINAMVDDNTNKVRETTRRSSFSVVLTGTGIFLVVTGFVFQIVGAWPI